VRSSTKSHGKHTHHYTGKKGIGFKNIYRIADKVWVSSRQYRFKFDKRQRFGMIAPVWAEFPRPIIPEVTSFFLKLVAEYEERDLARELENVDPRLLLFLHPIRIVVLRMTDKTGTEWLRTLRITNTQTATSKQRSCISMTTNGILLRSSIVSRISLAIERTPRINSRLDTSDGIPPTENAVTMSSRDIASK
jgi:hypothetical protein